MRVISVCAALVLLAACGSGTWKFTCNGVKSGRSVTVEVGSGYQNTPGGLQGAAESFCADEIGEACQCSAVSKSSANVLAPSR